jgi:polysaccharide pyruvyl transferase WcaK-like protein
VPQPRIVLISKTKTQNQGNQALSIAWRDYLSQRFPGAQVRLLERAPRFLKRYDLATLKAARDPVAAFDEIARDLLRQMPATFGKDPSVWDVHHDFGQKQVVRFLWLRQMLRVRNRIAALGLNSKEYLDRLAYMTSANLVVVNPAGEFYPAATDTGLHYLLETRCAQLAGCRTAFVNCSFEVSDSTLIALSEHVFRHCDVLQFRDSESLEYYKKHGGTKTPLIVPDGALLSAIEPPAAKGGRGLGLAINALQVDAHNLGGKWDALLDELTGQGHVTLTSNEWSTDFPFWKKYLSRKNVSCDGEQLDYAAYSRSLAEYDVVVSSRLHTCILGLVSGAAVIPVETGTFKLTGFFNQIGMPGEPVRMGDGAWDKKILERIQAVRADRKGRVRLQNQHVAAARNTIRAGLDSVFIHSLLEAR